MTGYERALGALTFHETDCVPTWGGWVVSPGFFEHVTGKSFWTNPRAVAFETYRKLQVDMFVECFYLPETPEEWRSVTDEAVTAQQRYGSPENVVSYVQSLPGPEAFEKEFDYEGFVGSCRSQYNRLQGELGPDMLCIPQFSCAKFIWYVDFGYQNYLEALALYPDAMRRLFDYTAAEARLQNMARAELVREKVMPPFFLAGNDICGNRGPMVSPELLRLLYFPALRRALEPLVDAGAEIIWHSDGYILPILDDLVSCGVSGFQGFQEEMGFEIRDVAKQRVRGGRKPILLAGLSVTTVLPFGTVDDVQNEVRRIIDSVGSGGGLAIGTANTAGPDCRNENLLALYRYTHRYSRRAKPGPA